MKIYEHIDVILLMDKILLHLGCPKGCFFTSIKTFWGIPGGAGLLSSTVWCNMI